MFPLNIGYYNASPKASSVFILLTDSERSFFYNKKKHWLFRVWKLTYMPLSTRIPHIKDQYIPGSVYWSALFQPSGALQKYKSDGDGWVYPQNKNCSPKYGSDSHIWI